MKILALQILVELNDDGMFVRYITQTNRDGLQTDALSRPIAAVAGDEDIGVAVLPYQ